jgi:uncharacterized protein (TIGR02217 family)
MLPFLETPRFPENISYGSSGGPGFKTFIFEGHTGIEARSIEWSIARARYNVSYGIRDKDDMDDVRAFFYATRGRAIGFRYKDWGDYQLEDEQIGIGDGVQSVFPIIKTYQPLGGALSYVRRIFKPVADTVVVKVSGTPQTLTTHYTLNSATGVITFTSGNFPADTAPVTVDCEFDVPVRFDTDNFDASHEGFLTESWSSIPLIELLQDELE